MCSFSSVKIPIQYNIIHNKPLSLVFTFWPKEVGGGGTQQNVATAKVFNETFIVGFIIMVVLLSEKKGTKATNISN